MTCNGTNCASGNPALVATYSPEDGGAYQNDDFVTDNDSVNLSTTMEPYTRDENLARWEILVSAVILITALIGNSIVVLSLWRRRRKISRMHFFILHLCIADLLTAVLSIFPQMVWDITFIFYAPDFVCRLVKYGQVFPMYLSTYILVMTAIDRYIAICHPLLGLRGDYTQRMRIMIAIAYGASIVFAIPQMVIFSNMAVDGGFQCHGTFHFAWSAKAYVTFFAAAVYIIPSLILGVMYGLVSITVWRNMGKTSGGREKEKKKSHSSGNSVSNETKLDDDSDGTELKPAKSNEKEKEKKEDPLCRKHGSVARVSRAKVKTIKMTLTIVTVYIACWTPYSLAQLWYVWHPQSAPFNGIAFTIIMLLANLNACCNPFIYLAFSGNVKREALQTLCCFKFGSTSDRLDKKPYANDRSAPVDENSSRYASTTHVTSKTLYSTLEQGRDERSNGGYPSGNLSGPTENTQEF